MNDLGLKPLNEHVVQVLQHHSQRNREGFKLDFRKQYPITFRDSNISGMVDGDASYRRLSVPLRVIDRVNARLHGDRFLQTEVPLLLRNYGTADPSTLNRQRTLVHRAILLNEFASTGVPAYCHLFSPVLVAINNPAGTHIGLIQYDRTHNGEYRMYQLMAPPALDCRVKELFCGSETEETTIPVTDEVRKELDLVYGVLRKYFSDDCPPERSLCLAETPDGFDVVLFNLAQLQVQPGFELMQLALLADYTVPAVDMTFAVNELFQVKSPYWKAAVNALHAAEYGVYLNHHPNLDALETLMMYGREGAHISRSECRQIVGILLDNGFLRLRDGDTYEADADPEILRAAIAEKQLSYEELLAEEERPFANAVLLHVQKCDRIRELAGHFTLLGMREPLSEERAGAVLAKLEGAEYITRVEPAPGEVYFRNAHPPSRRIDSPVRHARETCVDAGTLRGLQTAMDCECTRSWGWVRAATVLFAVALSAGCGKPRHHELLPEAITYDLVARRDVAVVAPLDPTADKPQAMPDARWVQPGQTRTVFEIVSPREGTLELKGAPALPGQRSRCRLSFRDSEGTTHMVDYTVGDGALTHELDIPPRRHGYLEVEVLDPHPVHWEQATLSGRIRRSDVNILFITIDTLRADHVGAYGYDRPVTPWLDTLAQRGFLFPQFYVSSNLSSPSHATMLTGRYPQSHGIRRNRDRIDPQQVSLPQYLAKAGYLTAVITNWRMLSLKARTGHGFEQRGFREGTPDRLTLEGGDGVFPAAASWLQQHREYRFFLWLHSEFLHMTDFAPAYVEQFAPPGRLSEVQALTNSIAVHGARRAFRAIKDADAGLTPETLAPLVALYDANLRLTDDHLAAVEALLRRRGLDVITAIVVTSDHGMLFGENGELSHLGPPHEKLIHVPLVGRLPGITPSAGVIEGLAESVDIAPTLCDYVGVKVPRRMHGRSLLPAVRDGATIDREHTFAYVGRSRSESWYGIREARWQYITDGAGEQHLYSVADPDAVRRVADADPAVLERLQAVLGKWLVETPRVGTGSSEPLPDDIRDMLIKSGYLEEVVD